MVSPPHSQHEANHPQDHHRHERRGPPGLSCDRPLVHTSVPFPPSTAADTWSDKRYSCGSFLAITHGHRLLIYNTITDIVTVFNHVSSQLFSDAGLRLLRVDDPSAARAGADVRQQGQHAAVVRAAEDGNARGPAGAAGAGESAGDGGGVAATLGGASSDDRQRQSSSSCDLHDRP